MIVEGDRIFWKNSKTGKTGNGRVTKIVSDPGSGKVYWYLAITDTGQEHEVQPSILV